jgi:hypothetical protein
VRERSHGHVVEAPGTAPGSERLITTAFIAIAGRIRPGEYRCRRGRKKACLVRDMCRHIQDASAQASGKHVDGGAGATHEDNYAKDADACGML